MKKWKTGLLLTIAALALAGCDEKTSNKTDSGSSSSPISENSSASDTSSSSDSEIWSNEETALMNEYCGGILPQLQKVTGGELDMEEMEDSDGNKFLVIKSDANTFTIEDYYTVLQKAGWNVIKGYSGSAVQTDSTGISFVELTHASADMSVGYDMVYYYKEASTDEDGNDVAGCNVIQCYNDLTATATDSTNWTDDEKDTMIDTITTEVPFVQLGSLNRVYSPRGNVLSLIDVYTEDLTLSYVNTLVDDGFVKNDSLSASQDMYVLTKTLTDGATVSAYLYYMNGNNFNFIYTPKVTSYTTWPSALLKDIEDKTGVTIPEFPVDINGKYYVFTKNDTLYIQGETTTVDSWSYEDDLHNAGLIQDGYGEPYTNWNETIAVECDDIYDNDYSTIGIQLAITVTEPTSTFTETWPTSIINDTIKNVLGVTDYTLPAFDTVSSYTSDKLKYEVHGEDYVQAQYEYYLEDIKEYPSWYEDLPEDYTEDDIKALAMKLAKADAGIEIKIKDNDVNASYEAYEKILYNLGYHQEYGFSGTNFEDKDGKVNIALNTVWSEDYNSGTTTITIKKGSGETHEPVLEFASESYSIGIGKSQKLQLNKDMLPYDVTYSSSSDKITVNDKGFVTVSSTATSGDTATITAKVTTSEGKVITATCTVTAIEVLDYDADSAIAAVNKLLKANGYDNAVSGKDSDGYASLTLTFDTSKDTTVSTSSLKTLCEGKLMLEGFVISYTMDVDTGDEVAWSNFSRYENEVEIGTGVRMGCEFYYEEDEFAKVELTYNIYTLNDSPSTLILEIVANNTDY